MEKVSRGNVTGVKCSNKTCDYSETLPGGAPGEHEEDDQRLAA
jgi:hypothetical protein